MAYHADHPAWTLPNQISGFWRSSPQQPSSSVDRYSSSQSMPNQTGSDCPTMSMSITMQGPAHHGKIQPALMGTIATNRNHSPGPGSSLGNKELLHPNTTTEVWKDRLSCYQVQMLCRKPLQKNPCRHNTLVPMSITCNQPYTILERAVKQTDQLHNRQLSSQAKSQERWYNVTSRQFQPWSSYNMGKHAYD